MTNPTSGIDVSDSAGWFPQIFLAEGSLFDVTLKDANSNTIRTELNVSSLGQATSTFTRDFGNSRARIAGSGGIVSYEAGDPAGDDVGGQIRIGGYASSQAVTASIDAAATNTTGTLKVNSLKLPGLVSSENVASAVASIAVALPNTPAGVTAYEILLTNIYGGGSTTLQATFSYDNGATYAATNYATYINGSSVAGTTLMTLSSGAAMTQPLSGRLTVITTGSAGQSGMLGQTVQFGAAMQSNTIIAYHAGSANARVTHVKFTASSGNLTGLIRVVPLFGTGDA